MNEINFWDQKFKIGNNEQTFLELYHNTIVYQQIGVELARLLYKKGLINDDDVETIENNVCDAIKNKVGVNLVGISLKEMFEK